MMAEVALGIRVLRRASNPEGFNIGVNIGKVAGVVIDHVHTHVVPRWGRRHQLHAGAGRCPADPAGLERDVRRS